MFFIVISIFYFSEENIKKINKSRLLYMYQEEKYYDLPILYNDTNISDSTIKNITYRFCA